MIDNLSVVLQRWKVSCFRREETSSEFHESKNTEDKLPECSVDPELDQPGIAKEDWISNLRKVWFVSLFLLHLFLVHWKGYII